MSERFEEFVSEFQDLCNKYNVMLSTDEYNYIEIFYLIDKDNDKEFNIEDRTKE